MNETTHTRTGFIGLGIMGAPMAANLQAAGHTLTVYNRSPGKAEPLLRAGAVAAADPAAVAAASDTIILMLTGPAAIDAVLTGPGGLASVPLAGKRIINMSTVPPAYTEQLVRRLSAHGARLVDAPVSGSKKPAEDGSLVILAGGDEADIAAVESLLLAMGSRVIRCGDTGHGSAMKMAINLLLATMMAGLAEAVNLGEKNGLDPAVLLDTVLAGPLGCGLFQLKRDMFVSDTYPAQFPFRHMAKDLGFILETARHAGAAVPLGQVVAGLYRHDDGAALADQDFAAVKQVLAAMD
jgi:3-hydroxyisobutyrate dehydrogenase-like beta-hydroxyacid dehydrogenase